MGNSIFKYTEFLLLTHNCIIIPDLGGFIINSESMEDVTSNDNLCPPQYSLIFNQDLKHNDGFLFSFIQNQEKISYDASCKKIKNITTNIKSELQQGSIIDCANMGKLFLNENHTISFIANENFTHPLSYGLNSVNLKRLIDINISPIKEARIAKKKHYVGRIAAAAAMLLFFISPSINLNDNQSGVKTYQQADFSYSFKNTLNKSTNNREEFLTLLAKEENVYTSNGNDIIADTPTPIAQKIANRTYYIIIGSEESKSGLNILRNRLKKDFPDLAVVETASKYRIYTASFDDKSKAEEYLSAFRKDNPKYQTAWLYSKGNN